MGIKSLDCSSSAADWLYRLDQLLSLFAHHFLVKRTNNSTKLNGLLKNEALAKALDHFQAQHKSSTNLSSCGTGKHYAK